MSKRYAAPTGVHGFRRRLARRLMHWLASPAEPSAGPLPIFGIHRILVCRTSHSLGNSLLLTPLLAELEQLYPGAEMDIVTQSPAGDELYGAYHAVRNIMRLPSRFPPHMPWVIDVINRMRSTHYDLAIDPDPRSKTGRLLLRLAHARFKVGYAGSEKHGDVTHGVGLPDHVRHVAQLPVHLLRSAAGRRMALPYPRADLRLSQEELLAGRARLAGITASTPAMAGKPVIGIFANATGSKRLPSTWWFDMLERLESLLPGHAFIEFPPAGGDSLLQDRYPTAYCSNLRRLAACLAHLAGFISVDSGPMHLAWAAGTPTFGIFTGTDTAMWGPYGDNGHVMEHRLHTPGGIAEIIATHLGVEQLVA